MKIVFVNSAWPASWGGGEKWTVEAAEWFRENGHEVCVVARPQSKLAAAAQGLSLLTVEHRFGGDFDPLAILRARQVLKAMQPDLVVVNFNKEAWQFGLAARKFRIPVIARHGFPLLRDTIHHHQLAGNVLSGLVVNAGSIRDQYTALGFDTSRARIIHNGTKPLAQRPGELRRRFGIAANDPLLLAAGRIESQKRLERAIEILKALVPAFPNLRLLIAGEGPMRGELQAQVDRNGLDGRLVFAGFVPDLAEIMGDADLFLLTSDDEGTPNVLLEAMSAGVASVAFGVGAVPEILAGDLSANLIPPGDVAAMTRRADHLLRDSVERRRVVQLGQARVQNEFSFEHSMQQFAELFEQIVQMTR